MVGHEDLILQGMLSTNSHDRLVRIKRSKARLSGRLPPRLFLLQDVEEGNNVPQTVVELDVAVGDRDQQDLELLRRGTEGQKHSNNIVDAWTIR